MPRSKPFSASSFADSCPIPESEAVTMATGLMSSPLVRKTRPFGSMPRDLSAQTEYSHDESKSSVSTWTRKSVRQLGLSHGILESTATHHFLAGLATAANRRSAPLSHHPRRCVH